MFLTRSILTLLYSVQGLMSSLKQIYRRYNSLGNTVLYCIHNCIMVHERCLALAVISYLCVYTILYTVSACSVCVCVRVRVCLCVCVSKKRRRVDSTADPQRTHRRQRNGLLAHVKRIQPATRCYRAPKIATAGLFPYTGSKGSAVQASVRQGVGIETRMRPVWGGDADYVVDEPCV